MLHFICAFPVEARGIIEYFKLIPYDNKHSSSLFLNNQQSISLTLSGMGKQSASRAVTETYQKLDCSKADAWLNVGIAGHGNAKQGDMLLAHTIIDNESQEKFYPQILFPVPCNTSPCISLNSPSKDYGDCLFDMEASGFYASCIKLASAELIHCLKIVSDTPEHSFENFKKEEAYKLIQNNIFMIEQITNSLLALSAEFHTTLKKPVAFDDITEHWHFTQSQKFILEKLLLRWQLLLPQDSAYEEASNYPDSKTILDELRKRLDSVKLIYD